MRDYEVEINEEELEGCLDSLIEMFGDAIVDEETKPGMIDAIVLKKIEFAEMVMKMMTKGMNVRVSTKLHEPFRSMGSVTVEGTELVFVDSEWFSRAAEFANNMEVYPLTNGKVKLTLTYHGLVKSFKKEDE